jgi:hypothetical protein
MESAKNKGDHESRKFALHVDTDRLDRNFLERRRWMRERESDELRRVSAKAMTSALMEAPNEPSKPRHARAISNRAGLPATLMDKLAPIRETVPQFHSKAETTNSCPTE